MVKNLPAMQENAVQFLVQEDTMEKDTSLLLPAPTLSPLCCHNEQLGGIPPDPFLCVLHTDI